MRVKAQRWGNSLAVRISKAVADAAGIKEQEEMDIQVRDGVIQLRPHAPEPSLEVLTHPLADALDEDPPAPSVWAARHTVSVVF
ncbi:MAG: AbrB/MazE/SpoVT family DNA-binding domain-containing protein [Chromatiales bacterium]